MSAEGGGAGKASEWSFVPTVPNKKARKIASRLSKGEWQVSDDQTPEELVALAHCVGDRSKSEVSTLEEAAAMVSPKVTASLRCVGDEEMKVSSDDVRNGILACLGMTDPAGRAVSKWLRVRNAALIRGVVVVRLRGLSAATLEKAGEKGWWPKGTGEWLALERGARTRWCRAQSTFDALDRVFYVEEEDAARAIMWSSGVGRIPGNRPTGKEKKRAKQKQIKAAAHEAAVAAKAVLEDEPPTLSWDQTIMFDVPVPRVVGDAVFGGPVVRTARRAPKECCVRLFVEDRDAFLKELKDLEGEVARKMEGDVDQFLAGVEIATPWYGEEALNPKMGEEATMELHEIPPVGTMDRWVLTRNAGAECLAQIWGARRQLDEDMVASAAKILETRFLVRAECNGEEPWWASLWHGGGEEEEEEEEEVSGASSKRRKKEGGESERVVVTRLIGLDCEMVRTSRGLELARVTMVERADPSGPSEVLVDMVVRPPRRVEDHLTIFSGMTAEMLSVATETIVDAQRAVLDELNRAPRTILVGHSLENDLRALQLSHLRLCDTAALFPPARGPPARRKLRDLALELLSREIQGSESGHCSEEDALAALDLVLERQRQGAAWGRIRGGPLRGIGESLFSLGARAPCRDGGARIPFASIVGDTGVCRRHSAAAVHLITATPPYPPNVRDLVIAQAAGLNHQRSIAAKQPFNPPEITSFDVSAPQGPSRLAKFLILSQMAVNEAHATTAQETLRSMIPALPPNTAVFVLAQGAEFPPKPNLGEKRPRLSDDVYDEIRAGQVFVTVTPNMAPDPTLVEYLRTKL